VDVGRTAGRGYEGGGGKREGEGEVGISKKSVEGKGGRGGGYRGGTGEGMKHG